VRRQLAATVKGRRRRKGTIGGVSTAAGIVLAGGRSSRMGTAKAALEWHGSTLLRRVVGILQRSVAGPLVVVRAPGQELPALPASVAVVDDSVQGRGPLQGLASGLAAVADADVAFVASTDIPLLHPAFVRRVVAAVTEGVEAAAPLIGGRPHPLAAAYRPTLLPAAESLLARDQRRLTLLLEVCATAFLDEAALLSDPGVAEADPDLRSVRNVNDADDYRLLRALPLPPIRVELVGGESRLPPVRVPVATLGAAAELVPLPPDRSWTVTLNDVPVAWDPEVPVVAGDTLRFRIAASGN
jgi:molybdopterin-guanine dinucleotide biosynthesis protein A